MRRLDRSRTQISLTFPHDRVPAVVRLASADAGSRSASTTRNRRPQDRRERSLRLVSTPRSRHPVFTLEDGCVTIEGSAIARPRDDELARRSSSGGRRLRDHRRTGRTEFACQASPGHSGVGPSRPHRAAHGEHAHVVVAYDNAEARVEARSHNSRLLAGRARVPHPRVVRSPASRPRYVVRRGRRC